MSIWDDPKMQVSNDYIRFDEPGTTITGRVQNIELHKFDDGSVAPKLTILTAEGHTRILTAGPIRLKQLLAEKRPEIGDELFIQYTGDEKRAGGKSMKLFQVAVDRAVPSNGATPPTNPPAAPF